MKNHLVICIFPFHHERLCHPCLLWLHVRGLHIQLSQCIEKSLSELTSCCPSSVSLHRRKYISNRQFHNVQAVFGLFPFSIAFHFAGIPPTHSSSTERSAFCLPRFAYTFAFRIVCTLSFSISPTTCRISECAQRHSSDMCWVHTPLNPRHNPLFICAFTCSIDGALSGLIRLIDRQAESRTAIAFTQACRPCPSWDCNGASQHCLSAVGCVRLVLHWSMNSATARVC